MRRTRIAVLALTALLAACGGDDGGSGGSTGATGGSADCTDDTAINLTDDDPYVITIQDRAFGPPCFAARLAASITIDNRDSVTHTFTIDGTEVDVSIEGGETFQGELTGLAAQTYPFHCTIHPTMTGTVMMHYFKI